MVSHSPWVTSCLFPIYIQSSSSQWSSESCASSFVGAVSSRCVVTTTLNPKSKYYHTICCGESGIVYGRNIFQGMYFPLTSIIPNKASVPIIYVPIIANRLYLIVKFQISICLSVYLHAYVSTILDLYEYMCIGYFDRKDHKSSKF